MDNCWIVVIGKRTFTTSLEKFHNTKEFCVRANGLTGDKWPSFSLRLFKENKHNYDNLGANFP